MSEINEESYAEAQLEWADQKEAIAEAAGFATYEEFAEAAGYDEPEIDLQREHFQYHPAN